jgi:hypothetical protein
MAEGSASASSGAGINNQGAGNIAPASNPIVWIVLGIVALAALAWFAKKGKP